MVSQLTQLKDNLCPTVQIIIYFLFCMYSEIVICLKFNRKQHNFYIFLLWLHPQQPRLVRCLLCMCSSKLTHCYLAVSHLGWYLEGWLLKSPIRYQRCPMQPQPSPTPGSVQLTHSTNQKQKTIQKITQKQTGRKHSGRLLWNLVLVFAQDLCLVNFVTVSHSFSYSMLSLDYITFFF